MKQFPGHIDIIEGNPRTYKCTICCKTFKSKSNCCYHKHCADGMEKPYSCLICGRKFSTKTHHTYHSLMHTGVNPFKCTQCSKSFKTKNKLLRHQEVHLEKHKNYSCDICGRLFLRKTSIKVHKRSHTGEKPYRCSQCPKAFTEKKNLIHHISSHTRIKNWVCEICGNSFAVKWNLELHKRTHTRIRPFSCPVSECQLSFSQNRYLKRHMETHKSSIKYVCSICEKVFSRKDNLQRHIGNTHLEHQLNTNKIKETNKLQKQVDINVNLNVNANTKKSNADVEGLISKLDNLNENYNKNVFVTSEINTPTAQNKLLIENTAPVIHKNDENFDQEGLSYIQQNSNREIFQRDTVIKSLVKNINNRISVIKKVSKENVVNFKLENQNMDKNLTTKEIEPNNTYEESNNSTHQKTNASVNEKYELLQHYPTCTTRNSSKIIKDNDNPLLSSKYSSQLNDVACINYNKIDPVFQEHHLFDTGIEEKCRKKSSNTDVVKFHCFLPKKLITASYRECSCSACINGVSLNDQNIETNFTKFDIQNGDEFKSKKNYDNNLLDLSMKGQEY